MLGESPSLTNEQEHQRLVTALRESEFLRELAELLASSLDLTRTLHVVTERTAKVCEVERCSVWLVNDTSHVFRPAAYYLASEHILQFTQPRSIAAADRIWYSGSILFDDPEIYQELEQNGLAIIDDLRTHTKVRAVANTFLVYSILLVALKREGRIVGMLSLDDPAQLRTFSPQQQQLARAIGQQAVLAIDNARLYQESLAERQRAQRLIERAQAIYQVALAANSDQDLKVVLQTATEYLVRSLNANSGAVALLESDMLHLIGHTQQQELVKQISPIKLATLSRCQEVAAASTPLFIKVQEAQKREAAWYRKLGSENILIVPLGVGVGQIVGFLFLMYDDAHATPTKGEYAFAQDIAAQCALAIEKAHLLASVRQTAALATERFNTLNAVFQAMTEGITVINQQGEVVARNKAAAQFLGGPIRTMDELSTYLQRHPTYTLHGQEIATEDFPLTRALKGEHIRGERFITTRSDGIERVIEMNVTHMLDDNRQHIGLVSAFRDVTEQTLIERSIRQALETMLLVAEAVSGITDIRDILQSILPKTLTMLNCSRGLVQLYDEESQTFQPFISIGFREGAETIWVQEHSFWLSPETQQDNRYHQQVMEGHAIIVNGQECPFHPNPLAHLLTLVAPIMYHEQTLGLMMLDRSPITQTGSLLEKERQEFSMWDMAVIEAIAQLAGMVIEQAHWQQIVTNARTSEAAMREANALKDEFLAITAHEFRTPLTVVLAHCQMALRVLRKMSDHAQTPRLKDSLVVIEEQTHQLTGIVNSFLEVTQLNRGQLVIKSELVDVAEIVKQVVTNYQGTSELHELSYTIAPSEHPYLVQGDSSRLLQVLANLIQNAIKYSPLGGPISVSLSQALSNETQQRIIEICVADTGIGIPQESLPRLFERFYRAPNTQSSKTKGIGLGLYIVAELIRLHGGTIHAESTGIMGDGSRFIFTLPTLESSIS